MTDTIKGRVNKKWTSDDKYREGFDRIFGKKDTPEKPEESTEQPTEQPQESK
jgi:hypothetical protein